MKHLYRLATRSRLRLARLFPGRRHSRKGMWFLAWLGHLQELVEVRPRPAPFFKALRGLLERESKSTLGDLMDAAGEQTYGLLIMLLALPNLVPGLNVGTAPLSGLGILWLGIQMAMGRPHPHLPARLRNQVLHKNWLEEALARLEGYLERIGSKSEIRRSLHQRWTGVLVAWTALLLAVPVPLPFGNLVPGATLVLLGAALVEERPVWGWLGAISAIATTTYFGTSYKLIAFTCVSAFRALVHGRP
ncbi:MAG: transporter permease [Holophagaceae bacterium]|nr:transporter permease [Holophagaceae bacterium]